ncbi:MAG: hypothetical protein ABIS35_01130 [Terracoccus sp.]
MDVTAELSADLTLLTQALDRPGTDLTTTLRPLVSDAELVADSFLGLRLFVDGEPPYTLLQLRDGADPDEVRTSILIPLGDDPSRDGSVIVLYAARPGAFVDLAADLTWLTEAHPHEIVLDRHLTAADLPATGPNPRESSAVNQAIGLLIGRGREPEAARAEIATLALEAGTDQPTAALHLLETPDPDADGCLRR